MNEKLTLLAARRQRLILQVAEQRSMIVHAIAPLRKPLSIADRGLEMIGYFRENPLLMAGMAALLGIIRPLRYTKWLHAGWVAFKLARNVRRWLTH